MCWLAMWEIFGHIACIYRGCYVSTWLNIAFFKDNLNSIISRLASQNTKRTHPRVILGSGEFPRFIIQKEKGLAGSNRFWVHFSGPLKSWALLNFLSKPDSAVVSERQFEFGNWRHKNTPMVRGTPGAIYFTWICLKVIRFFVPMVNHHLSPPVWESINPSWEVGDGWFAHWRPRYGPDIFFCHLMPWFGGEVTRDTLMWTKIAGAWTITEDVDFLVKTRI